MTSFETLSGSDVARAFGVDKSLVSRWKKAGMPHHNGAFSLPKCIGWRLEREAEAMAPADVDEIGKRWLNMFRRERARRAKLERLRLQGDLVSVPEVLRAQAVVCGAFKSACRSWKSRLPPVLTGKTQDEMLPLIQAEMDGALRTLAASLLPADSTAKPALETAQDETPKGNDDEH